jgi:hypothetical protein
VNNDLEGIWKEMVVACVGITGTLNRDCQCPGKDSHPVPLTYKPDTQGVSKKLYNDIPNVAVCQVYESVYT